MLFFFKLRILEAGAGPAASGVGFTAADLIRSVNKRTRHNYIRRRLLTTYKALERLSQSSFNLDQIAAVALTSQANDERQGSGGSLSLSTEAESKSQPGCANVNAALAKNALTINDVEREQGRPLSKYDRNMMIFNWLHNLDSDDLQSELLP